MNGTVKCEGIIWSDKFQTYYGDNTPVYPNVDGAVKYAIKLDDNYGWFRQQNKHLFKQWFLDAERSYVDR